jgi:hypothetical protein
MHDENDRKSVLRTLRKTVTDAKHLATVAKAPFLLYLLEMVTMGVEEEIKSTSSSHANDDRWRNKTDPRIG